MTVAPEVVIAAFGVLVSALGRAAWMIYRDVVRDRDYWRSIALRSTGVAEKSTDVAVTAVNRDV